MTNFVEYDFREAVGAHHKAERAKNEYQAAEKKLKNLEKEGVTDDPKKKEEFDKRTKEVEKLRQIYEKCEELYEKKIAELSKLKERKFLRYLTAYVTSNATFFEKGFEELEAIKPQLDEIENHIQLLELKSKNVKEGYLLRKNKGLIPWSKMWFVLSKEGLLFCYKDNKVVKKDAIPETALNVTYCSVRPYERDKKNDEKVEDEENPFENLFVKSEKKKLKEEKKMNLRESRDPTVKDSPQVKEKSNKNKDKGEKEKDKDNVLKWPRIGGDKGDKRKGLCFEIIRPGKSPLILQAETDEEYNQWMKALKDASSVASMSISSSPAEDLVSPRNASDDEDEDKKHKSDDDDDRDDDDRDDDGEKLDASTPEVHSPHGGSGPQPSEGDGGEPKDVYTVSNSSISVASTATSIAAAVAESLSTPKINRSKQESSPVTVSASVGTISSLNGAEQDAEIILADSK
eukprot:TRINITY_DN775_c0_g1_i3.p1 TRINITY_DN775_c0_g1~~TRINITY_DN775_c0_g1_i3.p1  ORF type:complete len:459 (-),score=145.03 TRINITY_DN775_c0_g1_i3:364-1740(-)